MTGNGVGDRVTFATVVLDRCRGDLVSGPAAEAGSFRVRGPHAASSASKSGSTAAPAVAVLGVDLSASRTSSGSKRR